MAETWVDNLADLWVVWRAAMWEKQEADYLVEYLAYSKADKKVGLKAHWMAVLMVWKMVVRMADM
jgi:hypothetical protein